MCTCTSYSLVAMSHFIMILYQMFLVPIRKLTFYRAFQFNASYLVGLDGLELKTVSGLQSNIQF